MHQKIFPVVDLHCDLLSYLIEGPGRSPLDPASRASLPAMKQGNVAVQVLALFVPNNSHAPSICRNQVTKFLEIQKNHPEYIEPYDPTKHLYSSKDGKTQCIAAFENSSGFCSETDPIDVGLKELAAMKKKLGPIAYISMTWDGENRFGGGVGSKTGLKQDGLRLLEWMDQKQIPIDVSHASDFLIDDIFNTIDKKGYTLPVIASHSNMRYITDMPRNLPDELASEIIHRKGLIGLNFFCHFSGGKTPTDLLTHIEHAFALGAQSALCLGADFFGDIDFPYIKEKYKSDKCFYEELGNSSCYPRFFDMIRQGLQIPEVAIEKIAYSNADSFFKELLTKQAM